MVYLVCGKICSGKSYYARQLAKDTNAVILSCDELVRTITKEDLGSKHEQILKNVKEYLLQKAVEIVRCGTGVIFEWGFWTRVDRVEMTQRLTALELDYEWHYIDVSKQCLSKNIESRNRVVNNVDSVDYYVDEGLLEKCISQFEVPDKEEIKVWIKME